MRLKTEQVQTLEVNLVDVSGGGGGPHSFDPRFAVTRAERRALSGLSERDQLGDYAASHRRRLPRAE